MKDVPQGLRAADIAVAASTRNINGSPKPTRFVALGGQDTMPSAPQRRFITLGGQEPRPKPRVQLLSQPVTQEGKTPVVREPKRESPRDEVVVQFPTLADSPPAPVATDTTPTSPVSIEETPAAQVALGNEGELENFWYTEDVPEADTLAPIDVADASTEHQPVRRTTRVKPIARATLAMSAAALAAACTSPSSTSTPPEATHSPGIVKTTEHPGPNNSMQEIFNNLEKDKTLPKNKKSIDVHSIAQQYNKTDYKELSYKDPTTGEIVPVDSGSAPVIEIRYDKSTGEFTYEDQTPQGLTKEQQYELLLPIMEDDLLLRAAFETGRATRIALRLLSPGTTADENGYQKDDLTEPAKGPQNTIFVYLPGTRTVTAQYIRDATRHESIHAVTSSDPMGDYEGVSQPSQDELSKWNAACVDLRDVAITEAMQHKQKLVQELDAMGSKIHNEKALKILSEVRTAMSNGEFDTLQPKPGEKEGVTPFTAKIPDCRAVGPYEAFTRLLKAEDPAYFAYFEQSKKFDDDFDNLMSSWDNLIGVQTVYNILRDGAYHTPTDITSGHPYDNWDELITSTCELALGYPNEMARNIRKLSAGQREAVLKVVEYSMKELASQIPDKPSNAKIHQQISSNVAMIINNSV